MANDRTVSLRVTEEQFNMLQKEAKNRKLTVSNLLREVIFPSVDADAFQSFKNEVFSANQEMKSLLLELTKHVRFSESVAATLYSYERPGTAEIELQEIKDNIFNEVVNLYE